MELNHPSSDRPLAQTLAALLRQDAPNPAIQNQLTAQLLEDAESAKAFGITVETIESVVEQRSQLFRSLYAPLNQFCQTTFGWRSCPMELLWTLWLPLAMQILEWHRTANHTLIQGILGGQGTGKTTLTILLAYILNHMGVQVCRLSIDDLYKTYRERVQVQQTEPRLRWRGPPGTHDIELGLTVLHQLRRSTMPHASASSPPIAIPRFDKSAHNGAGDRTQPEWVTSADIVLFEGWFVGIRPIDPATFDTAPPPILTEDDRAFARDINTRLHDYLPLWDQLDRLIVLNPTDYHLSQQWRQQAEQHMIASGKSGMSEHEINEFVQYFWRSLHPELFIPPLLCDPDHVDLVIEIDTNHIPRRLYRTRDC